MKAIDFKIVLFIVVLGATASLKAQCKIDDISFEAGEFLTYDLYFKYGLLFTKAGNSTLSVSNAKRDGKEAYKMMLTANSSGAAKSIYSLSDTLIAYTTKSVVPILYIKNAHEGKDFRSEKATYEYLPDRIRVRNINKKNGNVRYDVTLESTQCIYDYISVIYYARSLDYSKMNKGDKTDISFLSGRKIMSMQIEHHGFEVISANDGRKYNCIKLVLVLNTDEAFEDKDEAMKVYITNDPNRIPIRIDSKLKVGATRAMLKSYKGQKY